MAKVMVIAGGKWQCPIVKLAKKEGHFVVCANLYQDSPAFQFADVGVVANVLDKEKNLQIAKEYSVDAVLTAQSDISVPTVAYIAEKLKLKGIGTEISRRFTDKHLMRKITADAGFASPKYKICSNVEEVKSFFRKVNPCIIKPLDSQSSRGVHIIDKEEEIDKYWEDCLQYSHASREIVVEEYIDGIEFTVDGLKTPDNYIVTAISQKEHFDYNPNVASRLFFSLDNDTYDYNKLRDINSEMVKTLGLPFGLTHAEYKYKDGEFYLIEIAARGGGTRISSDIVPLISGINSEGVLLDILLDSYTGIQVENHYKNAVLGFFDIKSGIVEKIDGVEQAQKMEGVCAVEIELKIGDVVAPAKDDRSRCGFYIIYGNSEEEVVKREKELKEIVKVVTV